MKQDWSIRYCRVFVPGTIVSAMNFGILDKLSVGDLFLNVIDRSEMVVDTIHFAFSWLPCRMGYTETQLFVGESFH